MRFGFFLGFLIGAALASVLAHTEHGEAPAANGNELALEPGAAPAAGPMDQLRELAHEAMEAARKAAQEKEAEMLRGYDGATKSAD